MVSALDDLPIDLDVGNLAATRIQAEMFPRQALELAIAPTARDRKNVLHLAPVRKAIAREKLNR